MVIDNTQGKQDEMNSILFYRGELDYLDYLDYIIITRTIRTLYISQECQYQYNKGVFSLNSLPFFHINKLVLKINIYYFKIGTKGTLFKNL